MIPTLEEAKAILEPYHSLIREVIDGAWEEWRATQAWRTESGFGPVLYPRVVADNVFDGIARRAILAFGVLPSVRVEIEAQTFKVHFRGLTARFKKGGEDRLGCNWPTQAALAFMEADASLPGLPPETGKVEFIWTANELRTELEQVLVVARDGDRLIWEYEIERKALGGVVTPFPTPLKPDPSDVPLVTPKPVTKPNTKLQ